jgi:outer membrane usher protein
LPLVLLLGLGSMTVSAQEMVLATVSINTKPVAELLAVEETGSVYFESADLAPLLTGRISQDVLDSLFTGQDRVGGAELSAAGLGVSWDPLGLVFSIDVPSRLSPVRDFAVARTRAAPTGTLYEPEPFSAILNLSARAGYTTEGGETDFPLFMDSSLFVNLWSWVLELGATGEMEAGIPDLSLTTARVVRDFLAADSRLVAGRLDSPATGFQSSQRLLGLSMQSKSFSNDRRLVSPALDELVLERSGTARIFLNGALLRTERLDPGAYQLSDLPFSSGLNKLEVEVDEAGAQPYRFVHVQPHDESFLGAGGLDYALAFGFEESAQPRAMGSAFLRLGLTDRMDASLSFQAGFSTALLGVATAVATGFGNLSLDAGVSLPTAPEAYPAAFSLASRYRLSFPGRTSLPSLGLSAQYSSAGFSAPRLSFAVEPPETALRLSGSISSILPGGMSGSLTAENRKNLDDGTQSTTAALTLRRRMAEGLTVSGLGTLAFQPDGTLQPSLTLTVQSAPPGSGQNFQYSQGLTRRSSIFDLSGTLGPDKGVEASLRGTNPLGHEEDVSSLAAQSRVRRSFGDFGASAAWEHDPLTGLASSALSLSGAGALVLAGGHLKYTRPVADSFVLLAPQDSLRANTVDLQLGSGRSELSSTDGKTGVGPLASYRPVQGYVNLPDGGAELVADQPFVVLSAGYRSGLVVRPGVKPNLGMSGRLLDALGDPVAWTAGSLAGMDGVVIDQGFTDAGGLFEFYGLAPGTYTISWASKPAFVMEFDLGADGGMMSDLGEFRMDDR